MQRLTSWPAQFSSGLWILAGGQLLVSTSFGLVYPYAIIYFHDVRHLPVEGLGIGYGLLAGAGFVGRPFAARILDVVSYKIVYILASATSVLAFLALALFATTLPAFWLVLTCWGLAAAGEGPSEHMWLRQLTDPKSRVQGLSLGRVASNAGLGLGGLLGGTVLSVAGMRAYPVLMISSAVGSAVYLLVLWQVPARLDDRPESRPPEHPALEERPNWRSVLSDHTYLALVLVNMAAVFCYLQLEISIPYFAHRSLGAQDYLIGIIFAINTGMVTVLQIPVARFVERRDRVKVAALGLAVWAVSLPLFGLAAYLRPSASLTIVLFAVVAYTVAELIHNPAMTTLSMEMVPATGQARYFTLMGMSWALVQTVGPALCTALLGSPHPEVLWWLCALVSLVAAFWLARLGPSIRARGERQTC